MHNAGRVCSRNEGRRRFTWGEMDDWLSGRGVLLAGGDLDESSMAYRRLPDVLTHHAGSVRALQRHVFRSVKQCPSHSGVSA